ncbi:DAPG hydrolase family protein [Actinomycetes bacterium M1A6_2h]
MLSNWTPSRRRLLGTGAAAAVAATVAMAPSAGAAPLLPVCSPRYQGYRDEDRAKPYARYMAPRTTPAPQVVQDAFGSAPLAPASIPGVEFLTRDLGPSGYSAIETGYGQRPDGVLFVAVKTEMPRVTAAMWDWWFGWHSNESAKYKLWHPDAHLHASLRTDLTGAAIPDKARYIGNTSYVDEYVGPKLQQLGIEFRDPVAGGFTVPEDQTVVYGRVGSSIAPVDLGWLAHQVRPIAGGAEMRSRFYLNVRGLHLPNLEQAACAIGRGASVDPTDLFLGIDVAKNLLMHCGQEMNHLAGFLPELYAEFA